ncbi:Uu.00g083600.m01.CDS01 [Anthostomella pinea]|uniref:Cytochrome P450 monooxygenase ABA1 n=1 Tax=Anthostomella pinea TaxID=933095 RepID=A0AAI8VLL8_9PEZI|nr:Uu.00g083600.m01.CDS01 [Anthostomella pinea]
MDESSLAKLRNTSFLYGLGVSFVVYLFVSYTVTWLRLRHINGPLLAKFSYFWLFSVSLKGKQALYSRQVIDKHGPLVRIGPNDLLTDDVEVIRRMNGARSKYGRSNWYHAMRMDPYQDSLFSIMDTPTHDKLKAQLSFGYGGKENPEIEDGVNLQIQHWLDLIRRKYTSNETDFRPMDFARVTGYFTLDAITKIAYGKEFGYLATESDVYDYMETMEGNVPKLALFSEIPAMGKLLFSHTALKLIGPKLTDKTGIGKLMAVAHDVVGERFGANPKIRQDMLGSFLRHGISQRQAESEVMFQIVAGSDTTATALRGTMLLILLTPRVYRCLQQEIDTAVTEGRLSTPMKADEAKQLRYLQAVINEGLRLSNPFTALSMKEVPPEGDTIHGHFIPGGTRIGLSISSIHRSKAIFGADAEVFRPERWLLQEVEGKGREEQDYRYREMAQAVDLTFGYGRWACSGKAVAFMELNKVFVELLRNFDFQLVDPVNPIKIWNHNLSFQNGMWVRITERRAPTT